MTAIDDLVERLRKRRALFKRWDGYWFHGDEPDKDCAEAADAIERLMRENFALAADQCEDGIAGEHGEHRCKIVDQLRAELAAVQTKHEYTLCALDKRNSEIRMLETDIATAQERAVKIVWKEMRRPAGAAAFVGDFQVGSIVVQPEGFEAFNCKGISLGVFPEPEARAAVERAAMDAMGMKDAG